MSDFETDLRLAFGTKAHEIERVCLDRVRNADYQRRARDVRILPVVSVASAAVAAAILVVVFALSSGTAPAFAGWTAVPSTPTEQTVAIARKACGNVPASRVIVSEQRGPYTALVYEHSASPWQCVTRGRHGLIDLSTEYPADLYIHVPTSKITIPSVKRVPVGPGIAELAELYRQENRVPTNQSKFNAELRAVSKVLGGRDAVTVTAGVAGAGVTAVVIRLADGRRVSATVHGGWYTAWWPGASLPRGSAPVSVSVTSAGVTRSATFSHGSGPYTEQDLGCTRSKACRRVFASTYLKPGVPTSLKKNFAIFDNTKPVPAHVQNAAELGMAAPSLDHAQTRRIRINGSYVWVTPGTEWMCLEITGRIIHEGNPHVEGGPSGCGPLRQHVVSNGMVGLETGGLDGTSYVMPEIVPNGNPTITFGGPGGATRTVRVHDNLVLAVLPWNPLWQESRAADGHLVRRRL